MCSYRRSDDWKIAHLKVRQQEVISNSKVKWQEVTSYSKVMWPEIISLLNVRWYEVISHSKVKWPVMISHLKFRWQDVISHLNVMTGSDLPLQEQVTSDCFLEEEKSDGRKWSHIQRKEDDATMDENSEKLDFDYVVLNLE